MTNSEIRALDIALATQAHAMFARLLTEADKKHIAELGSTEELVAFLRGTPGWGRGARELPSEDVTDRQFILAIERVVYEEYARLYRFAEQTAKDFLIFIAMRVKCRAILAALSRLASGSATFQDPLPPFFHRLPGYDIDALSRAKNLDEVIALAGPIYGRTLSAMPREPETGLPRFAEAALLLEGRYYALVADFLRSSYAGPDKNALLTHIGFRADMLNISYLLRLRRFKTPLEKARAMLVPIGGSLDAETQEAILTAPDEETALARIRDSRPGRLSRSPEDIQPDKFVRTAENLYFRKVIHGEPTLSVAYAFLVLKENESDMLRRVYVALQYGIAPAEYMD